MVTDVTADEVLARLDPEERDWVETFCDRVREAFGLRVRDLRLFGSKARGDDHEESDIDLLVLIEDATSDERERVFAIGNEISPWLTVMTFDFDTYHSPRSRASGFYKEMRTGSVRL